MEISRIIELLRKQIEKIVVNIFVFYINKVGPIDSYQQINQLQQ